MEIQKEMLQIRYVDLTFTLAMVRDCYWPRNKVSALRGGVGQMLLAQNCIRDRNCEKCDFEEECLVRRTIYSKYEIQPTFAKHGDSIGYVIECEDMKEEFQEGDRLYFHLLLYGKTIMYFSQFLQAFYMLGQQGVGKDSAQYQILKVQNENGDCVVDGFQADLQKLGIKTVLHYAQKRFSMVRSEEKSYVLNFQSPTTIKYERQFLQEFHSAAVIKSVIRRIFSFDCFEGIEIPYPLLEEFPPMLWQKSYPVVVRRISSNSGKMELKGLKGQMTLGNVSDELLLFLLAGEKLHIGKNTSFGFGRYVVHRFREKGNE